jgi:hypothetical protein
VWLGAVRVKTGHENRFWFDDTCSPEETGAIRPLLEKHQRIIPPWIDTVRVECRTHDAEEPQCLASMHAQTEYRRAKLTIFALWLGELPEHREQTIVHELLHLYTHAQRLFTKDVIILATAEHKTMGDYLREQERKVNEGATEDLTLLLRRLGYLT